MVYESRVGDVFVLGASSWRIEDITADRVLVLARARPAGQAAVLARRRAGPPAELGRAHRRVLPRARPPPATAGARGALRGDGLDELAAANLISYLADQRAATGYVPDDQTLVVERFRDELGDWRLVLHCPYGARVHAPWALAIAARLRERYGGMDVQALHTDDGIVIRVPDADDPPPAGIALLDPDEVERARHRRARRFGAVRLPVPGVRRPGAAAAPAAAGAADARCGSSGSARRSCSRWPASSRRSRSCWRRSGSACRTCSTCPALTALMRDLAARRVRLVEVETPAPSPVRALAAVPLRRRVHVRGRRAAGRAPGPGAGAGLGAAGRTARPGGLRELLDPDVVAETERDPQYLSANRRCRDAGGGRRHAARRWAR